MARAMKDSGIEWIGEIPEGWKVSKVSTFFDIQLGKMLQPSQENESDTYESYLCAANLGNNKLKMEPLKQMWFSREDKEKFSVRCGDLLVVEGGDVASSDIIAEPVHGLYIQNALHRVRSRNGFELRFLRYYLSIAKASGHIDLICNKATIAHFTKDKFGALPYVVVPLEEQKRIADYLDSECARIDAVIEQTRASIEEYKKLKQSVITQAVTKGIRPGRKMKDSGVEWIGEIPEEWTVRPLKSYIDILPGYAFSSDDFNVDQGIRLLRGINVAPGSIRWDDVVYWNKEITDQIKQFELKEGDLVVGLDRPWISDGTRAAFLHEGDMPCLLLQRVCRIRPNKDTDIRFVYHTIVGKSFEDALGTDTTGVSVPHISTKQIQQYLVAFPCKEEQMEISDYIDEKSANIDALIQKKQQLLDELESYKKSLIFEYVTGKKVI